MDLFSKWVLVGVLTNAAGTLISHFTEPKSKESNKYLTAGLAPFGGFLLVPLLFIFIGIKLYSRSKTK